MKLFQPTPPVIQKIDSFSIRQANESEKTNYIS